MADLATLKTQLDAFIQNITPDNRGEFLYWMKNKLDSEYWGEVTAEKSNEDVILERIQTDLRDELPPNAMSSTETLHFPHSGNNADCDPNTTVHVDGFLYDEDAVDELCDDGKMSRNYCAQCGSHNVKPLTFITHSASPVQVKFIFRHLLTDLRGKKVLDVGSRTGAMLYGAYLYSKASSIVGVEMDPTFCSLQSAVISRYKMADRIQVIHDDIQGQGSILASSDVVILNNVFEFFAPADVQERLWMFILSTVRKDALLVTIPSLEDSLQHVQSGGSLIQCVESLSTDTALQQAQHELLHSADTHDSELANIHLYVVKAPYTVHTINL